MCGVGCPGDGALLSSWDFSCVNTIQRKLMENDGDLLAEIPLKSYIHQKRNCGVKHSNQLCAGQR